MNRLQAKIHVISIAGSLLQREFCSQLRSQLFYLWTFVAQQDLWEDALDFLDEHCDPHTPVDFLPSDTPF